MNRLPLVVVFRMSLPVRSGNGLRRFVRLESQVAFFVCFGFGFVAQAVVAEHQVVVRLQIFRIDAERVFKFFHGVRILLLQKIDAPQLVAHHAVARILLQHDLQVRDRLVILAFFFQDARVEEIRARQVRFRSPALCPRTLRAPAVSPSCTNAADIHPAVGILRIGLRDFLERRGRALQIALQKQPDAVIVPPRPIFFRSNCVSAAAPGLSLAAPQIDLRVFGNGDDRQVGNFLQLAGNLRSVAVKTTCGRRNPEWSRLSAAVGSSSPAYANCVFHHMNLR